MTAIWPRGRGGHKRYLALAVAVGAALLLGWVGSQAGARDGQQPTEWTVTSVVGEHEVKLQAVVGYCGGAPKPRISHVGVRNEGDRIYLSVFVQPKERDDVPCRGVALSIFKRVHLARKLSQVELFDASSSPPMRRWPVSR